MAIHHLISQFCEIILEPITNFKMVSSLS